MLLHHAPAARRLAGWAAFTAALCLGATPALGERTVRADLPLAASFVADVEATACDNSGGPQITLNGNLLHDGVAGVLRAQNASGVHSDEVDAVLTASLTSPLGHEITIPKQPAPEYGGVGGNPWIWFQATDGDGGALTSPVLLGRCVQGLFNIGALLELVSHAEGTVDGSCDHTGPNVTIEGALVLGGVDGNIIFTNQRTLDAVHKRTEVGRIAFEIIPEGGGVTWPKQPFRDTDGDGEGDGVTGNPLLFFRFADDGGDALSDEVRLGRCNRL
jgi:hypothetical protein